ncbi:MAG: ATP-dependent DNA helicase RecG [Candidatus Eisenbacteria bacterium]|nr:ATP-dependent DNA helicase RecG [Candidatus Eisenbacteria bacterium]
MSAGGAAADRRRPKRNSMELDASLRFLPGAGPARARLLAKLELHTLGDLLEHYPRAYLDRTRLTPLGQLRPGEEATAVGTIRSMALRRTRGGRRNVHLLLEDESGIVECIWFNQPFLERVFRRGARLLVAGRVDWYRRLQFKNPEYELLGEAQESLDDSPASAPGIVPVYPLTAGISQKMMRKLVRSALQAAEGTLGEFLPAVLIGERGLLDWPAAQQEIHFPSSHARLAAARRRIGFQELFDLQMLLAISRRRQQQPRTARPLDPPGALWQRLVDALPFQLTAAQQRAIERIRGDLRCDHPMHLLLEGDVGCGKTLVALAAALLAIEAGVQVAFMAPTEILALQHAETFSRLCGPLGVRVACLRGSLPAASARRLRAEIASGAIRLAVGTHALIQQQVAFAELGLVVVDEQHRFGVLQRARLLGKGRTPHALIMTATPIPRTLALTLFGDLDLTVIDEKPPGRHPPRSRLVPAARYAAMLEFIAAQLESGAQAYFVCPLIAASEELDLRAASELFERLTGDGPLRRFRAALLHGRMKSEEKERVMRAFAAGDLDYLVTTTVIEVGVDVPNASLMIVEHPERYGLSQLHQLRGRVGRGRQPAHFFMVAGRGAGREARERLRILVREEDGFRIAEEDLRLRGPGEFFGVRQSGLPPLRVADPVGDPQLLEEARASALRLAAAEPLATLRGTPLWRRLQRRFGERIRLYAVG